ncbi:MAG TPA: hypothetical protein PLH71_07015 [Clostridia bacterium]|nr:hypothetical protein [Clostridia bacterium]
MIKKISILLILVLAVGCLASCSKPSPSESNPSNTGNESSSIGNLNTDSLKPESYYTSFKQGITIGKYLETPYGTYYCSFLGYLYYSEKGNTKYIKLCNKPDCNHNSNDCNAYISRSAIGIGYYDNKIYYEVWNNINCMDMDGSNHKRVKTLYEGYDSNFGFFHNGYYYYVITKGGCLGAIGNDDNNLYRVKVDDDSKPEIVLTNDVILKICLFMIDEDNIYIIADNPNNSKFISLYSYSTVSKSWSELSDAFGGPGAYYINDDTGYCYINNKGFYEIDIDTKQMKQMKALEFENEGICSALYYPDYIYLIHYTNEPFDYLNQILYIYDWDYNLIDSVEFDKVYGTGGFVGDVDGYIIFTSNFDVKPDYYIDKSEIGTGNLMFHKIED